MDTIRDKKRIEIEQQFLYVFSKVVETFPQYTLSQHLAHIFRKKNEPNMPYFWNDILSLKKLEDYYDELVRELANFVPEIED